MEARIVVKDEIIRKIILEGHCSGYSKGTNSKICFAVSTLVNTICGLDGDGVSVVDYGHFVYEPTTPRNFAYIEYLITCLTTIASQFPLAIEFKLIKKEN